MARVPEDVGCNNNKCVESPNCQRAVIFKNKTAREIATFSGTEAKGCGKFLPKKEK